jgi:hypothetical protein
MHQQMLAQQQAARRRQVLMAQQYRSGIPNGMPINMHGMTPNQMSAAKFAMLSGTPGMARPINLPQYLVQQQQQAQDNINQQQEHQQQVSPSYSFHSLCTNTYSW